MKRFVSLALALILLTFTFPITALASEAINARADAKLDQVHELVDQRRQLIIDGADENAILEIDNQIEALGSVFIDDSNVHEMIQETQNADSDSSGIMTASIEYDENLGIKWVSTDIVYVYAGVLYDMTTIIGTPKDVNSRLFFSADINKTRNVQSFAAHAKLFLDVICTVASGVPNPYIQTGAGILSFGMTVFEVLQAIGTGNVNQTTMVSMPEYSCTVAANTEIQLVFASPYQDNTRSVLGYAGNMVNYAVETDFPVHYFSNGNAVSEVLRHTYSGTMYSNDYDVAETVCGRNYYRYQKFGEDFNEIIKINTIKICALDDVHYVGVPFFFTGRF